MSNKKKDTKGVGVRGAMLVASIIKLEGRVGFEPTNIEVAVQLLKPLGYLPIKNWRQVENLLDTLPTN